ncbi:hypothetical protein FOA52_014314 [Chlamydomonas sp. UWO 241]|nr:hypothetical protein FOA52_014314 [Chlamydomonas sp. UWO 241]
MATSGSITTTDLWSTLFTWRIYNFSMLTSGEPVCSDCFEAGICTWRLEVCPNGSGIGEGTHLSVYLEARDELWELSATFNFTVVNQADASKSVSDGSDMKMFNSGICYWGNLQLIKLTALRDVAAGWLVDDTLVLRVDITVMREDRFQLETGGVPCDVALKLQCGAEVPVRGQLLELVSPFFRSALEDVKGSALIPVDGSLGAWTYVVMDLSLLHDPPRTWGSVYTLLPVAHKYDFPRLLARLVIFVKDNREALSRLCVLKTVRDPLARAGRAPAAG